MAWHRIKNNPEARAKQREYQREWRRKQRMKKKSLPLEPAPPMTTSEVRRKWRKERQELDKQLVFAHYGYRCVRCGEDDPVVLTIDHIEQNGNEHKIGNRKRRISGYVLYRWLVKMNFPAGFRTACANCQIRFYKERNQQS